jgi:hypothetical protein
VGNLSPNDLFILTIVGNNFDKVYEYLKFVVFSPNSVSELDSTSPTKSRIYIRVLILIVAKLAKLGGVHIRCGPSRNPDKLARS